MPNSRTLEAGGPIPRAGSQLRNGALPPLEKGNAMAQKNAKHFGLQRRASIEEQVANKADFNDIMEEYLNLNAKFDKIRPAA